MGDAPQTEPTTATEATAAPARTVDLGSNDPAATPPPHLPAPPRYWQVVEPMYKRRSRLIFAACTAASLLVCGAFAWTITAYVLQGGSEGPFPYGAFVFLAMLLPMVFCIVCRGGLDLYFRESGQVHRFILEEYTRQLQELTVSRQRVWDQVTEAEQAAAAEQTADGESAVVMYTLPRYTPIAPPNEVVVIIDRPPPVYTDTHYLTADEIAELSSIL